MSRALLSFLGGLGTGALAQNEKNLDRARQERLDAQNTQMFDARMVNTKLQTAALTRADKAAQAQDAELELINNPPAIPAAAVAPPPVAAQPEVDEDGAAIESEPLPAPIAAPIVIPGNAPAAVAQAPGAMPAQASRNTGIGGLSPSKLLGAEQAVLKGQIRYHQLAGDFGAVNALNDKIKVLDDRDTDIGAYKEISGMTNAQLMDTYGKHFNANRNLDGDVSLDAATGNLVIKPYDPASPVRAISRSALEQAAFASRTIGRGNVAAGMAKLGELNADQLALVGNENKHRLETAKAISGQRESAAKTTYYNSFAGLKEAQAAGGGTLRAGRADHFDAKQWDSAAKIDKATVSLPNELAGKDTESGDLRSSYLQVFNAARAGGQMSPNEAVEHATTTIVKLKTIAENRVAQARSLDKASKLTVEQAIREIVKESARFKPKALAATPAPTAVESDMKRQGQLSPIEQANEDAIEANPEYLKKIDQEIANTRTPDTLRLLREERAKMVQRIAAGKP